MICTGKHIWMVLVTSLSIFSRRLVIFSECSPWLFHTFVVLFVSHALLNSRIFWLSMSFLLVTFQTRLSPGSDNFMILSSRLVLLHNWTFWDSLDILIMCIFPTYFLSMGRCTEESTTPSLFTLEHMDKHVSQDMLYWYQE